MKLKDLKDLLDSTAASPDAVVYLKLKLRGAERLGKGSQRTAYRIGNYVVKANTCAWMANEWPEPVRQATRTVPRKVLRERGLAAPATWYAGKDRRWVIQRFYKLIEDSPRGNALYNKLLPHYWSHPIRWQIAKDCTIDLDLHDENVGVTDDGRLVAFDW